MRVLHADWMPVLRAAAAILLYAVIAGCTTLRDDYEATPSYAFFRPEETTLGKASAAEQDRNPGLSGYRLINGGVAALLTRAAMADLAERSIDAQYYIYEPDAAGAFLLERLIAAAGRGVRVRILLDDYMLGFDDVALAKLVDAHPLIEIRVFNPFPSRARWTRPLQLALQLDRLGMRMHNKVFVADTQVAVLGGRNISDHYFEAQGESNFRDLDILASGPIVKEIANNFDEYWNSRLAVPIAAFGVVLAERWGRREMEELRQFAEEPRGPHAEYARRKEEFAKRLLTGADMVWARGESVAEHPEREAPAPSRPARALSQISRTLASVRREAKKEVVMVMAYYVPGRRGVEAMSELVSRGVRVRVLTNSLASTDVIAVHAGYSPYRPGLLAAGVELHEYRTDAQRPAPQDHVMRLGSSSDSALHAKVIVYDRRIVWIGSANSDPRSRRLNTEAGLLIESATLAERVLKGLERDFSPQQSWRLTLEDETATGAKRVVWSGEVDGKIVRLEQEPGGGLLRSLGVWFYSILPGLESQL